MSAEVFIERVATTDDLPTDGQFQAWVASALGDGSGPFEVGIRLVDEVESQALNARYRGKDRPTNVLSFPAGLPESVLAEMDHHPLGDLVICVPLVGQEAGERSIPVLHHWAHLVVHGVLHLRGYDHVDADDAVHMESLEVTILAGLGIGDPYIDRRDDATVASRQG